MITLGLSGLAIYDSVFPKGKTSQGRRSPCLDGSGGEGQLCPFFQVEQGESQCLVVPATHSLVAVTCHYISPSKEGLACLKCCCDKKRTLKTKGQIVLTVTPG